MSCAASLPGHRGASVNPKSDLNVTTRSKLIIRQKRFSKEDLGCEQISFFHISLLVTLQLKVTVVLVVPRAEMFCETSEGRTEAESSIVRINQHFSDTSVVCFRIDAN